MVVVVLLILLGQLFIVLVLLLILLGQLFIVLVLLLLVGLVLVGLFVWIQRRLVVGQRQLEHVVNKQASVQLLY